MADDWEREVREAVADALEAQLKRNDENGVRTTPADEAVAFTASAAITAGLIAQTRVLLRELRGGVRAQAMGGSSDTRRIARQFSPHSP